MTIEIKTPELEALIQKRLESGFFLDVNELLTKAIYALGEHGSRPQRRLIDVLSAAPFAGSELEIQRQKTIPA